MAAPTQFQTATKSKHGGRQRGAPKSTHGGALGSRETQAPEGWQDFYTPLTDGEVLEPSGLELTPEPLFPVVVDAGSSSSSADRSRGFTTCQYSQLRWVALSTVDGAFRTAFRDNGNPFLSPTPVRAYPFVPAASSVRPSSVGVTEDMTLQRNDALRNYGGIDSVSRVVAARSNTESLWSSGSSKPKESGSSR